MPELKFATPKPAPTPGQPTTDRSTGATIYPHATKEQLIERAHQFLAGGCHLTFPGIKEDELVEILRHAHAYIINTTPSVAEDCEEATDAAFGLERLLRSLFKWVD